MVVIELNVSSSAAKSAFASLELKTNLVRRLLADDNTDEDKSKWICDCIGIRSRYAIGIVYDGEEDFWRRFSQSLSPASQPEGIQFHFALCNSLLLEAAS